MKFSLLLREARRLHRVQPLRTALVGGMIAVSTAVSTAHSTFTLLGIVFTISILCVTRQSPRPERLAAEAAWRRAGTTRATVRNIGVVEAATLRQSMTNPPIEAFIISSCFFAEMRFSE